MKREDKSFREVREDGFRRRGRGFVRAWKSFSEEQEELS